MSVRKSPHKGRVIDAVHLLEEFAKEHVGGQEVTFDVLEAIEESARENLGGCEYSHDLLLKDEKLTIEDHLEACSCDCSFCEKEQERRLKKP